MVSALLCAGVAYASLAQGVVPGVFALLLLAGLACMIPTAPTLARRVGLNGALLIGWTPMLWWFRWPVPLNHGALLTAAGVGALCGLVVGSPRPLERLRSLVPSIHAVDGLMVAGGLAALAAMQKWAFARTPHRALEVLLPGADNYPHFNMFSMLRTHGATLDALSSAHDGTGWAFDNYPQGFHAFTATLSELLSPRTPHGLDMLLAYTHSVTAVVVLAIVVLTGAITSLPNLRDRPAIAAPVVVVTWTAFLWEPGQKVLADGFANFWLGAAAAGCALILAASAPRFLGPRGSWGSLRAAGGHRSYVDATRRNCRSRRVRPVGRPSATRAAPIPHATRRVQRRDRFPGSPRNAQGGCGACRYRPGEVPGHHLDRGATGTSPLPTFVLLVASLYLCASYTGWVASRAPIAAEQGETARRVRILTLAPLAGFVALTAVFVAQLMTMGSLPTTP